MQVKSKGKYIKISPIKARSVVRGLKGENAQKSLSTLMIMPQKSARVVAKIIKSAIADAEHNFLLDKKDLKIESICIDKGPSYKRWLPAARGSMKPIEKKTSNITVIVSGEKKIEKIKVAKTQKDIKESAKEVNNAKTHPSSPEATRDKKEIIEGTNETVEKIEEKKPFYEEAAKEVRKPEEKGFRRFFRRKTG